MPESKTGKKSIWDATLQADGEAGGGSGTAALASASGETTDLLPRILNMTTPQVGHLPLIALRPFFIISSTASAISFLALHLTQYPSGITILSRRPGTPLRTQHRFPNQCWVSVKWGQGGVNGEKPALFTGRHPRRGGGSGVGRPVARGQGHQNAPKCLRLRGSMASCSRIRDMGTHCTAPSR